MRRETGTTEYRRQRPERGRKKGLQKAVTKEIDDEFARLTRQSPGGKHSGIAIHFEELETTVRTIALKTAARTLEGMK